MVFRHKIWSRDALDKYFILLCFKIQSLEAPTPAICNHKTVRIELGCNGGRGLIQWFYGPTILVILLISCDSHPLNFSGKKIHSCEISGLPIFIFYNFYLFLIFDFFFFLNFFFDFFFCLWTF